MPLRFPSGRTSSRTAAGSPSMLELHAVFVDGDALFPGFVDGRAQIHHQFGAHHFQQMKTGLPRGRRQVRAGVALKMHDVQIRIDDQRGRRVVLQQEPLPLPSGNRWPHPARAILCGSGLRPRGGGPELTRELPRKAAAAGLRTKIRCFLSTTVKASE